MIERRAATRKLIDEKKIVLNLEQTEVERGCRVKSVDRGGRTLRGIDLVSPFLYQVNSLGDGTPEPDLTSLDTPSYLTFSAPHGGR